MAPPMQDCFQQSLRGPRPTEALHQDLERTDLPHTVHNLCTPPPRVRRISLESLPHQGHQASGERTAKSDQACQGIRAPAICRASKSHGLKDSSHQKNEKRPYRLFQNSLSIAIMRGDTCT